MTKRAWNSVWAIADSSRQGWRRSWIYDRRTAPDRTQSAHSSDEAPYWARSEGAQGDGFGKDIQMESILPPVTTPKLSKQDREVCARWAWTQPSVWTDRLLTALETGVKGDALKQILCRAWVVPPENNLCSGRLVSSGASYQPEGLVLEVRMHGSEEGGAWQQAFPTSTQYC